MTDPATLPPARLLDLIQSLEGDIRVMQEELEGLRESDRRSRAWLEHSPVCTKVLDLDFQLKYMSTAGVSALKLDDVTRYYCRPYPLDFFPDAFRDSMLEGLEHVRATGQVGYQEAPLLDLSGEEKWFRSTIVPVFDTEGDIEDILVVSIDITERRQVEEQRLELERQMQHAQKLDSLGVLSGGIAHDFNNLLMSILGNADLAKQDLPTDHEGQPRLLEIEKAARRGAELAEQMLAYSGRGKFVIGRIRIGEFVAEMAHLLEVSVPKKTELRLDIPDDLPTFDGDATQIRQVIMNLITNATESLGEEGGVITVTAGVRDCDRPYLEEAGVVVQAGHDHPLLEGRYVYFEVTDNGCGMDDAVRQKVFEPFFTTKFTGRGLGMSAVLGIVRGHRGIIRIASAPGEGSRFRVLFPVDKDQDSRQPSPESTSVMKDWRTTGTVLIADDEESVRSVGQKMLEHLGLQVLKASDGREAIETYRQHADIIDCVLLDLTMPELDGEQVFQELQRIHPEVQVILTSGYNLEDRSERFRSMGLAGFLQKPFDLAALGAQVSKAMDA